ncbi:MAG: 50S ribosomal protein L11, partial [Candidatus Methanomethylophilaceae archaeon]
MVDTVEALVDGGRASAGPPLGPALGPKGVNIGQIIAAINEKTKAFSGMKVPVKILIANDKSFEIKVGTPPMSALIKGELGLASGSSNARTTKVGNLTLDQAKKIADMKKDSLLGADMKAR